MRKKIHPRSAYLWKGKKVALFGGSFNPAHEGHRHIAQLALKKLKVDFVWWMVSPGNPLKSASDQYPFETRFKSAQKQATHPRIIVTDIEKQLGTRYTVNSLKKLLAVSPILNLFGLWGRTT